MVGVGQRTIVASVQLQCVTCNHTACMHDAEVLEQVPLLLRRQHYPALPRFATGAELHFDRYLSVILESLDVGACHPPHLASRLGHPSLLPSCTPPPARASSWGMAGPSEDACPAVVCVVSAPSALAPHHTTLLTPPPPPSPLLGGRIFGDRLGRHCRH